MRKPRRRRGDWGACRQGAALHLSRCASSSESLQMAHILARLISILERQQARAQADNGKLRRLDGDVALTSKTLFIIDEAAMVDTPTHRVRSHPCIGQWHEVIRQLATAPGVGRCAGTVGLLVDGLD